MFMSYFPSSVPVPSIDGIGLSGKQGLPFGGGITEKLLKRRVSRLIEFGQR
jgi:hypothetical protein